MARNRFRAFSGGWWPMGAIEALPLKTARRLTGTHRVKAQTLRSRPGSTLLVAGLTAHSLYRFAGGRYAGVGAQFYLNGVSIKAGLNGAKLQFARMAPQSGIADQLFVAGGGSLFKVDAAGVVTNWGIVAPATDPTLANGGAGVMGAGAYKYAITFKAATGSRSNADPTPPSITIAINEKVNLSNIPVSTDAQVTAREVWRTNAGGSVLFLLATIGDNVTTTYGDNTADSGLSSTQLPVDNAPPNAAYNGCAGPYYGRMFWGPVNITGRKGQVPYSASGRPESDVGFILVSSDDDPVQRVVVWNGSVWVWTQFRLYQIIGLDEPFIVREVQGAPGTTYPFSIALSTYGILYRAADGVYLFDGGAARLIAFEALGLLFVGETLEGVTLADTTGAEFIRDEYFLLDGTTTLALNPRDGTWRNVGAGLSAIYGEPDTKKILASLGANIVLFEETGVQGDAGATIAFEVESPATISDSAQAGVVQRFYVEVNTNGEWLVPTLRLDEVLTALPQIKTTGRITVELPVNQSGRVASLRLTGNVMKQIELFGIEIDMQVGTDAIVPQPVAGSKTGIVPMGTAAPS